MQALSFTTWPSHPELHPGLRVLVVNPFARGTDRGVVARVVQLLGLDERAVREVGRDGTVRSLAADAVRARAARVIAAGGDGTLHDVVQELAGSATALGVIPLGTSNDLAGRLGIPRDLGAACAVAVCGAVEAVDVLAMGDTRVATVGGFGLPAWIARTCNALRGDARTRPFVRPLGRGIYTAVAGARILARGGSAVECTLRPNRGTPATFPVVAVLAGLQERFGGGMRLVDARRLVPGTFAALVVTARRRAELLSVLLRLKLGRPVKHGARLFTGLTSLDLRAAGPLAAFGDGEWLGVRHRTSITVERHALRVVVPRHLAAAAGAGAAPRLGEAG